MTDSSDDPSNDRRMSIFEWIMRTFFACLAGFSGFANGFLERTEWAFAAVFETWSVVFGWFMSMFEHVGYLGQMLLAPFGILNDLLLPLFGGIANRVEWVIGESVDHAGSALKLVLQILMIPIRLVDGILVRLLQSVPWEYLRKQVGRLSPPWLLRVFDNIQAFIGLLATPYFVGKGFFQAWWATRDFNKLAAGSGAVILFVPVLFTGLFAMGDRQESVTVRYRRSLASAVESGDKAMAELCLAKLASLGSMKREQDLYHVAISSVETDGEAVAAERMRELAYSEEGGYHPAMIWLADHMLRQDAIDDEQIQTARELVRGVIAQRGETPWTAVMLAEAYLVQGEIEQAIAHLESVAVELNSFEVFSRLMELNEMAGDAAGTKAAAKQAVSRARAGAYRGFTRGQYLQYANALVQSGSWDSLRTVVDHLASEYAGGEFEDAVDRMTTLGIPEDQPILVRSLFRLCHTNQFVNQMLARQLAVDMHGITDFMNQQEAAGRVDSALYRMAGDRCRIAADTERAIHYYGKATSVDPRDAIAWNNQAWLHLEQGSLLPAIDAANNAVAIDPSPSILETRGQILAKSERWEEAIRDLEEALNGQLSYAAPAHATLSDAYAALGQADVAESHSREAAKLRIARLEGWSE